MKKKALFNFSWQQLATIANNGNTDDRRHRSGFGRHLVSLVTKKCGFSEAVRYKTTKINV